MHSSEFDWSGVKNPRNWAKRRNLHQIVCSNAVWTCDLSTLARSLRWCVHSFQGKVRRESPFVNVVRLAERLYSLQTVKWVARRAQFTYLLTETVLSMKNCARHSLTHSRLWNEWQGVHSLHTYWLRQTDFIPNKAGSRMIRWLEKFRCTKASTNSLCDPYAWFLWSILSYDSSALVIVGITSMVDIRIKKLWYDVMWCDVMWCNVMWCDVMWCGVMLVWCDVTWWDVMWCGVMCDKRAETWTEQSVGNMWIVG